MFFAIFIIYFIAITGCTSNTLDTKTVYRKDMNISVNGYSFVGLGIVPRSTSYKVRIESLEDVNLLTLNSCHRDLQFPDVITSGWFKSRRGYEFTFPPNKIEGEPGCPLRVGGYNREKGQHSWGLIVFEHPDHRLNAFLTCNGAPDTEYDGDSGCQTLVGLIQQISFAKPVRLAGQSIPDRCKIEESKDGKVWRFKMRRDECVYVFQEIESKEIHALHTFGYDETAVR